MVQRSRIEQLAEFVRKLEELQAIAESERHPLLAYEISQALEEAKDLLERERQASGH